MSPVLKAQSLSREYAVSRGLFAAHATVKALSGVSFSLEAGKTLAVVGESGSGKSTLARLLTLIETPTAGALIIDGEDVVDADAARRRRLRREVQMVFQNPYGSLNPRQKIGKALEEPLLVNTDMNAARARGGGAQRSWSGSGCGPNSTTAIPTCSPAASASASRSRARSCCGPKILVLDEPVSALDVSIRAQVLNLLAEIQEEFKLAYVFVSHDLSVVRHIADDVMVIYLGHAVEIGAQGRDLLRAAASLYPGAAVGDADRRARSQARADDPDGRAALAVQPAAGLRVPSALSRWRSSVAAATRRL